MELRHVRTFVAIAEEMHFGRAAARLHVVQSAVSLTLKALEEEVGTLLVARSQRRVALTAAGEQYLAYARRVLATLDEGAAAARRAADGESGRLVLRFTALGAISVLPGAIARMQREHPGVELDLGQLGSAEQIEAIRARRCDLGFIVVIRGDPGLEQFRVVDEPLMAVLPTGHRLASRRRVHMRDLGDERRIILSRRSEPEIYAAYLATCAREGLSPGAALEVDQIETMLAFVAAGVGISHAPGSIRALRMKGVVTVPITPRVASGVTAVWDARALPPAGERFLKILKEEKARVTARAKGG